MLPYHVRACLFSKVSNTVEAREEPPSLSHSSSFRCFRISTIQRDSWPPHHAKIYYKARTEARCCNNSSFIFLMLFKPIPTTRIQMEGFAIHSPKINNPPSNRAQLQTQQAQCSCRCFSLRSINWLDLEPLWQREAKHESTGICLEICFNHFQMQRHNTTQWSPTNSKSCRIPRCRATHPGHLSSKRRTLRPFLRLLDKRSSVGNKSRKQWRRSEAKSVTTDLQHTLSEPRTRRPSVSQYRQEH